ncbi:hypothetical protein Scep_026126 [Stephania cephalantha]|uniref:Uncharacterized protein n=1 Tax=Stephania cephalantha TaxID=152367 RepID=A0AAP0EMR8_9MAGN
MGLAERSTRGVAIAGAKAVHSWGWIMEVGPPPAGGGIIQKAPAGTVFGPITLPSLLNAHIGTNPCGAIGVGGPNPDEIVRFVTGPMSWEFSTSSVAVAVGVAVVVVVVIVSVSVSPPRFLFVLLLLVVVVVLDFLEGSGMGDLRAPTTEEAVAGTVPVPVAAMMEGSAFSRSQRTVSPSDLWPSSRVNWKIRAAQIAGMRILRPRPSTFAWRSLDAFFSGATADFLICCGGGGSSVSVVGSSFMAVCGGCGGGAAPLKGLTTSFPLIF